MGRSEFYVIEAHGKYLKGGHLWVETLSEASIYQDWPECFGGGLHGYGGDTLKKHLKKHQPCASLVAVAVVVDHP